MSGTDTFKSISYDIDFREQQSWSDIKLITADGKELYYSKFSLIMASDYFKAAFHPGNFIESNTNCINLPFLEKEIIIILILLTEIARGNRNPEYITIDNVLEYVRIADALELKILINMCDEIIEHGFKGVGTHIYDYEDCIDYINMAFEYNLLHAKKQISRHYNKTKKTDIEILLSGGFSDDTPNIISLLDNPRLGELSNNVIMGLDIPIKLKISLLEAWTARNPENIHQAKRIIFSLQNEKFSRDICGRIYNIAKSINDQEMLIFIYEKITSQYLADPMII